MDVGINLRNNGPYRIKIKAEEHKPFLWLTQFKTDKPSNVRFGPLGCQVESFYNLMKMK